MSVCLRGIVICNDAMLSYLQSTYCYQIFILTCIDSCWRLISKVAYANVRTSLKVLCKSRSSLILPCCLWSSEGLYFLKDVLLMRQVQLWFVVLKVGFCSQSQTECCAMLSEHCLQNNCTLVNTLILREQAANVAHVIKPEKGWTLFNKTLTAKR